MNQNDLKQRTKMFALKIIKLVETLPRGRTADVLGNQLLRTGTSVGANYRAACRARSSADFISKMGIVEEEIDESLYWIELLETSGMVSHEKVTDLLNEANQLTAITVASITTAKQSKRRAL
jgi:four helix bundle protein